MQLPATYLKIYLDHFATQPQVVENLLEGTGLNARELASSDRYLPFATVARVLTNAEALFDRGWHVRLAAAMDVVQHGPLGFAAVTAPTLRDAMTIAARYIEVRAPFAWLQVHASGKQVLLRCYATVDLGPLRAALLETVLVALANLVRQLVPAPEPGLAIGLPAPLPDYASAYEACGLGSPRQDSGGYALTFPASWMTRPCLLFDKSLHDTAVARCRDLLESTSRRSEIEFNVCEMLHESGGNPPGLSAVASHLNLSPRSLIRHLKQEGTSYQALVDEVHRTLARDFLLNTTLSVAQIGYRLGFSNPSNFGRAFRRWYDIAPGRYRATKRGQFE